MKRLNREEFGLAEGGSEFSRGLAYYLGAGAKWIWKTISDYENIREFSHLNAVKGPQFN